MKKPGRHVVLQLALFLLLAPAVSAGTPAAGTPAGGELRNQRIDRFLLDSMRAGGLDLWIVLTREGNLDPLSADFGFHLGRGALVFVDRGGERAERLAVVSSLDITPLRQSKIYDRIVGVERDESFEEKLRELLDETLAGMKNPKIGVNMSDADGIADGLSASSLKLLERALGRERSRGIVSAERTILSLRSKKLPAEIEIYREATAVTREILHEAFTDGFLRPGETTQAEVHAHVQEIAARRGFPELAWEADGCPGVYSGLFGEVSHANPGARTIEPGDILWIDFGIKDRGYATDMIRAGYVLRPGETEAPEWVRRMFETSRDANRAAVAAMRPGAAGFEVDAAARGAVTAAGYPEFVHSSARSPLPTPRRSRASWWRSPTRRVRSAGLAQYDLVPVYEAIVNAVVHSDFIPSPARSDPGRTDSVRPTQDKPAAHPGWTDAVRPAIP